MGLICKNLIGTMILVTVLMATTIWWHQSAWGATLIYDYGFENGFGDVRLTGGCYDYSFDIVNSPARQGNASFRVENRGGDDSEDCVGGGPKHRAEGIHNVRLSEEDEYWIGFSLYIPNEWRNNAEWGGEPYRMVIVWQHASGASPELILHAQSDTGWVLAINSRAGSSVLRKVSYRIPGMTKGRWTDWVIHERRSWKFDGTGFLRMWRDGQLVVDDQGPNAVNHAVVSPGFNEWPYVKGGIYWGPDIRLNNRYIIYQDSVKVARGADGYDLVDPANDTNGKPPSAPSGVNISHSE